MNRDIAIIFDCGATSVRVAAITVQGEILAISSRSNETDPDPTYEGGLVWDFEKLWAKLCDASKDVMAQVDPERIVGVSVTTFGVDGTFVDEKGEFLSPIISWQCSRSKAMMARLDNYISTDRVRHISGVAPQWFNTIYKMLWMKENRADIVDSAHRFIFIPSLIIGRLSGVYKNDRTMMGTSMMGDLRTGDLSQEILDALGLKRELFGEIAQSGEVAGAITQSAHELTHIPVGTQIVFAGHDTQFAIIGSGAGVNQPVLSSGTWEILMTRCSATELDMGMVNEQTTVELDAQDGYCNIGQNWLASGVLEWFWRHFYAQHPKSELFDVLIEEFEALDQNVEPTVWVDSSFHEGQGQIHGLSINTKRAEIYRAILFSLVQRLKQALALVEQATGVKAEKVICVGGGAKSRIWNQMRADVCNVTLEVIDQKETTVLGASKYVFKLLGESVASSVSSQIKEVYHPNAQRVEFWNKQIKNS